MERKKRRLLATAGLCLLVMNGCSDAEQARDVRTAPEVIDGHVLPPEPDPAVNNSTLLGVDINDNGVRDDVERWIYKTYDHPIERAIFMQTARAYQIVIADPSKAKETRHYLSAAVACKSYWSLMAKRNGESFWINKYRSLSDEIRPIQFNTAERFLAYEQYNHNLSGGIYDLPDVNQMKNSCDFNTTELLMAQP